MRVGTRGLGPDRGVDDREGRFCNLINSLHPTPPPGPSLVTQAQVTGLTARLEGTLRDEERLAQALVHQEGRAAEAEARQRESTEREREQQRVVTGMRHQLACVEGQVRARGRVRVPAGESEGGE